MYILVILLTLYFMFLLYSLAPAPPAEGERSINTLKGLSVLIPFRNEEKNLPELLASFENFKSLPFPYEIIFIDDHSTDQSETTIGRSENFRFIRSDKKGKKFAIQKGVKAVQHPWILTLDADILINRTLASLLETTDVSQAKMLLFTLRPVRRKGFIAAFFDLEFLALQGIGIGLADKGHPVLSNGACLLFEKKAFLEVDEKRTDYHIASGDDIFGMNAIAEKYGSQSIKVASTYPAVDVSFPDAFLDLFSQRSRWIAKTMDVPNEKYQILAICMGFVHLLPLGVLISLSLGGNWIDAVSLLFIKWVGEWILFVIVTKHYERRDLLFYLPFAQLLYPFYTFALIVSGMLKKIQFKKSPLNAAR